jgi:hypothetical protein
MFDVRREHASPRDVWPCLVVGRNKTVDYIDKVFFETRQKEQQDLAPGKVFK